MKPIVLSLLIDRAASDRDDEMLQANAARRQAEESVQMLQRLHNFHSDFLRRAPGVQAKPFAITTLQARQTFHKALDQAIDIQQHACEDRNLLNEQAQARLVERQKRLLALQSLHSRQKVAQQTMEVRREQRESDAWAARSTAVKPARKPQ
ncbi:MAG: flagellar FliJ family protein [Pseudomonadota bacterium]